MDRIRSLGIFKRIAETGSLSRVAQEFSLGQPAVSKILTGLEAELKVRLLNRNTRGVFLTLEGQRLYEQALRVLDAYEDLLTVSQAEPGAATGLIRMTCPVALGTLYLVPLLKRFFEAYPGLEVDLKLTDAFVDLYAEGLDLALRAGKLEDSRLHARRLGAFRRITVASRAYFSTYPPPATPAELSRHHCILDGKSPQAHLWRYRKQRQHYQVRVQGPLRVDSFMGMRAAILADLGIGLIGQLLLAPELEQNQLQIVLADYEPEPLALSLVYPQTRHLAERVRLLIDFIQSHWAQAPWLLP